MRTLSCLVLLVAVAMARNNKPHYDLNDAPALFEKFMKDYDRHYKDEADKKVHYEAFLENLKNINKLNEYPESATFDINQFADYTTEEKNKMKGYRPKHKVPEENY